MTEITRRLQNANSFLTQAVTEIDIAQTACQTDLDGLPANSDRDKRGQQLIGAIDRLGDALDNADEIVALMRQATEALEPEASKK